MATKHFNNHIGGSFLHGQRICAIRKKMSSMFALKSNDGVCVLRKYEHMKTQNLKHAKWVGSELERTGKKKIDLAKALGIDPAQVTRLLAGKRDLKADEIKTIRDFFGSEDRDSFVSPYELHEIDVRAGAGGGGVASEDYDFDGVNHNTVDRVKSTWSFPASFIRNELRSRPSAIKIVEVLGDSMEPSLKPGDRVLVDTAYILPSPPGIYAVWDGYGVVVKRIEIIPQSNPPMVRLISDNPNHKAYEVSLEDARIVGRIICKISTM